MDNGIKNNSRNDTPNSPNVLGAQFMQHDVQHHLCNKMCFW